MKLLDDVGKLHFPSSTFRFEYKKPQCMTDIALVYICQIK
jgi:hypothetical protein